MQNEKIRACWFCQQIYSFERNTSRYCSANCRVQDHAIRNQELEHAILLLKCKQKTERCIKSNRIMDEYYENLESKEKLNR